MKIVAKYVGLFILAFLGGWPFGEIIRRTFVVSPWFVLLWPVGLFLAKSAVMPLLTQLGVFRYYSPMLLVARNSKRKVIELHSGSLIDLLLAGGIKDLGFRWKKRTYLHFSEGLLKLIEEIKENELNDYQIEASSYFFNARTMTKFGFSVGEASTWHKFKLLLFSPEFTLMHSFSQGRLSLPPITKVRKATAHSSDLMQAEHCIEHLRKRLSI